MEAGNGGGDWRADLPPGARQRIAEKIFQTLLKWFPTDLTEGLIDLHRVAEKLEWRMYSLARNQGDYLRRISLRVLYFESPSPSPCAPVPQQPQLALPSQEDNHKLEVRHNGTEEDLLDTDPPRSHKKLCKEDRLSNLPDEMLHHIMSFLLAKELARTCVLSQRWRMLWTTTPCLDISIVQFCNDRVRFSMFVDHLLLSRAPASLDTFRLHSFAVDRACNWIDHAIKHNVRVLEFTECTWEPLFLDPQCIAFTSEFLTYLKLTNVALDTNIFDALNHACPSLETLQLICSFFEASEICPNSLKNLDIIDCSFSKDLMICTPNLISLCIAQCKSTSSFYNFSKITASVTLCDLSSAKNIELSSSVTEKFQFGKETLRRQMFDNLTSLSLGEWCLLDNFAPLVYFLLHSPQLKKLTLKLKVESDDGVEIDPVCLRERRSFSSDLLKKVIIFCHEGDARVAVLTTMLRANAKSLAEVEIRRYYKSCCQ